MSRLEGVFVTVEGGEGSGKTTLLQAIHRELTSRGTASIQTREPGGTHLGEELRRILLQGQEVPMTSRAELCLFLASRSQHIAEVIRPALAQKKVVLCDRFNDSTIVYQGAARSLGEKEVAHLCSFVSEGCVPDVTFLLDIDPHVGLKRALKRSHGKDRIESEEMAFHQTIRSAYLRLQRAHPERIHLLDATRSPDSLLQEAMNVLQALCRKNI